MRIDIFEEDTSTMLSFVDSSRSADRRPAVRRAIEAMMKTDAEWLVSRWCERLNGSVWTMRVENEGKSRGLVVAWLRHYREAIGRDLGHVLRAPDAGTEGWISGSNNPRVEMAYRIAILSIGRDVIEEYLNEHAFPSLNIDVERREEILDDLEAVFRVLTHQRIQHACEMWLHATWPGMRT